MKVLCVLGEHQYGDPSRGHSTEYEAFIPTLRRLGHEVLHFESWNRDLYADYAELNEALLGFVERERPDVMLAVQLNYELWIETVERISRRGDVATVCWTTDDSWKFAQVSRFIGHAYHGMTTTYPDVVGRYRREGIRNVLLTQWAATASALLEPLPAGQCTHRVSFVGATHGDRERRVARLRARGLEIECYGHGWPAGSVPSDAIPRIMQQSVVSLNFANSRGRNQVKARTFEVPGAGGFLLTEYAPGLETHYEIGREIEVFRGEDELIEKARFYLEHPAERDAIARAGHARTLRDHTYDARVRELLEFALTARDEWLAGAGASRLESRAAVARKHAPPRLMRWLAKLLVGVATPIFGPERGPRAARRLVFELSWRVARRKTFTAAGWPGRMFPKE